MGAFHLGEKKRKPRLSVHTQMDNSLKEVHFKRFGKSLQVVPFPEIMIRISGKVMFHLSFHFGEFGQIDHFKFRRNTRSAQKNKTKKQKQAKRQTASLTHENFGNSNGRFCPNGSRTILLLI